MKLIYGIIILLLSLTVLSTACSTNNTSTQNYDMLAQCMTANGATMYGTEWCPHCKSQKELFGKSFAYIDYVDCDKYNDECVNAGVEGYPTWKIN